MRIKLYAFTLVTLIAPTFAYRHKVIEDENGNRRLEAIPARVLNSAKARELQEYVNEIPVIMKHKKSPIMSKKSKGKKDKGATTVAPVAAPTEQPKHTVAFKKSKKSKSAKKSSKKSGGKGKGAPDDDHYEPEVRCRTLNLLSKIADINAGKVATAVGETFSFPFYDANTMEMKGVFDDAATKLKDPQCVYSGAFSMDYNNETETYDTQVMVSGTCTGSHNAITGGTGAFACASGYEVFTLAPSDEYIASTLYICSEEC